MSSKSKTKSKSNSIKTKRTRQSVATRINREMLQHINQFSGFIPNKTDNVIIKDYLKTRHANKTHVESDDLMVVYGYRISQEKYFEILSSLHLYNYQWRVQFTIKDMVSYLERVNEDGTVQPKARALFMRHMDFTDSERSKFKITFSRSCKETAKPRDRNHCIGFEGDSGSFKKGTLRKLYKVAEFFGIKGKPEHIPLTRYIPMF